MEVIKHVRYVWWEGSIVCGYISVV